MIMTPSLRKFALTAHIGSSVGLLGSIAAFLALALAGLTVQDPQIVRAAYLAMDLIAQFVIVPLALASLVTGLIQSLGTAWGLFRHYWVLTKLLLTAFATAVLLAKLELVSYAARLAAESVLLRTDLRAIGVELAVHAAGGLLVLLVPAALSVYKPWGPTPYGRCRQHEQRASLRRPSLALQSPSVDHVSSIGMRFHGGLLTITLHRAQLLGIVGTVLLVHFLVFHFAGVGHGAR